MQELLELSPDQVRDGLYIRRIAAARAAELQLQRREASAEVLPTSSGRQHPSDHLSSANAVAEKMKNIGAEEYKLHGIVTDALFNGVRTTLCLSSCMAKHPVCGCVCGSYMAGLLLHIMRVTKTVDKNDV